MNLLYSNYLKGSYVAYVDGVLTDYRTSTDNSMASYFADLQPNTTYTLTRITSTSRFRVATFYTDVKNSTGQIYSIAQRWVADSYNTITFTTGSADTHLVVYYTNSSQYDAQIMLNEGSEAEPYEAPTQSFTYAPWTGVDGEYPSNGVEPAPPFSPPYPAAMWRIDGAHNNDYPWHELLRNVPYNPPPPPPEPDDPERANWLSHWFIRLGDIDTNKKSVMGYISQKADRTFQPGNFKSSPHWNNSVQELNDTYYRMLGIDSVGGLIEWNYIEGGET